MSWVLTRRLLIMSCALAMPLVATAEQPSVKVEPPQLGGSRALEKQTEAAVIRDYLQSWESFRTALNENGAGLLDPDFVGTARDKLAETIAQQIKLGIHTRYGDLSHDLQFVFYSPEGQSIQLIDTVEYDEQVLEGNKALTTQRVKARYLVVLTPAEVRWRVRILQAEPER
jgi:hypothetical protein